MSIQSISNTIAQAMTAAGLDTRVGAAKTVMETIRAAFEGARIAQHPIHEASAGADKGDTIDIEARVVHDEREAPPVDAPHKPAAEGGQFLRFDHAGASGSRAYKLYVPGSYCGKPLPMVVMLHGCKQNPDDFAAGTRINELAEEAGFLVAYPAQSVKANGSNCWNWFEPHDQTRNGTEPSIIAGIVREIGKTYQVDERRVFAAGLSAGAAMAVILGQTHPDVFAAVGAHSGLPYSAAHDVASAFALMHGGAQPANDLARAAAAASPKPDSASAHGIPTIVFHGDRDATVVPGNGASIAQQAVAKLQSDKSPLTREVQQSTSQGRRYTRVVHADRHGCARVEQWTVHGAGHAWSGGSSAGSFTDPRGPDATREIVRFFLALSPRPPVR